MVARLYRSHCACCYLPKVLETKKELSADWRQPATEIGFVIFFVRRCCAIQIGRGISQEQALVTVIALAVTFVEMIKRDEWHH